MTFLNKEDLLRSISKKIWQTKETLSIIECQMNYLVGFDISKDQAHEICRYYSEMLMIAEGVNDRIQNLAKEK